MQKDIENRLINIFCTEYVTYITGGVAKIEKRGQIERRFYVDPKAKLLFIISIHG